MKHTIGWTLVLALILAAAPADAAVRNVIVMISDGWGQSQLDATAYWHGERQPYESGAPWHRLGMTTYMRQEGWEHPPYGGNGFAGIHGYDPAQAWSDWEYQQNHVTDSAAAATAMSTGVKTYQGAIGYGVGDGTDGGRERLRHVSEAAESLGLATGVVTSVMLSHGTPAGFCAHNIQRENFAAIAREMIYDCGLEVVMGAGHPNYDRNGGWAPGDSTRAGYWAFVGGLETWLDLEAGTAGGETPWTLIDDLAGFKRLATGGDVPARVFGVAPVRHTLQWERDGLTTYNDPEPPYATPRIETVPTLALMTRGALKVLERDTDGFFLMVEGGAVDWAGHGRTLGRLIEEQDGFNAAFDAVVEWVEAESGWDETLVIVTGDHECGFLWGPGVDPGDAGTWFAPIVDNGRGRMPGFRFYSEPNGPDEDAGHSNEVIPFFCRGYGSERLLAAADETDPVMGPYLDNTELALAIFALYDELAGERREAESLQESGPQR